MYLFNNPQVDSIISLAMNEDIGTGDITTLSTIPADKNAFGRFIAKEDMIICGIDLAKYIFAKVDTSIEFNANFKDGDKVVIIEDVTTAGTSIRETLPIIRDTADAQVCGLVVSVDRCERGTGTKSALEEIQETYGLKTTAIVTMKEVVSYLYNREVGGRVLIDDDVKARIDAYYQEYGV